MKRTEHAWLLLGDEVYGTQHAVRHLMQGLRDIVGPDAVRVISVRDGHFSRELRDDGFRVEVLDVRAAPAAELRSKVDAVKAGSDIVWELVFLTRPLVRELRVDVPLVLNVAWPALVPAAAVAARRAGTRVAFHEMNNVGAYPFDLNARILSALLRRCDGFVLPCSEFVHEELGPSFVAEVLPLAVDTNAFLPPDSERRAKARAALDLAPEARVVGVLARLDPTKGQHLLIDALAQPACSDVVAVIAGGPLDSEYGRSLVAHAAEKGVADRVLFTGRVSPPTAVYDALDVVLNLRTDPEPFGLSVIEAVLMRLPVIAHDLGGPSETIRATGGGVLLSDLGPARIASAISDVLDGRTQLDLAGASSIAAELYSIPTIARRYLECLAAVGIH